MVELSGLRASPEHASFANIIIPLTAFAVAGGFGGVVAALNLVRLEKVLTDGKLAFGSYLRLAHCAVVSGLTGIAGGLVACSPIAVQIAGKEQDSNTLMIGIIFAIIGGFAGVRGLEIARNKMLSDQVAEVQNDQKRLKGVVSENQQALNVYTRGIGAATLELSPINAKMASLNVLDKPLADSAGAKRGIEDLEEAKKLGYATDRTLGMLLGRLYRWSGEWNRSYAPCG